MKEYISIDLETTGLNNTVDRVIEIGAVRFFDDGEEVARFSELVKPPIPIPQEATAIHGITNDMVIAARPFSEVVKDFFGFIGKSTPLMAHNAPFDCRFLTTELRRCFPNHTLNYYVIDTLKFAKMKNRILRSYSLQNLVREYGLQNGDFAVNGAHRALEDCLHVKNLWLKLEGPSTDENLLMKSRICNHGI